MKTIYDDASFCDAIADIYDKIVLTFFINTIAKKVRI